MKNTIENQITEVEQKLSFLDQKIGDINTTFEDLELTFVSSFNGKFSVIVSLSVLISGAPESISLYPSS